MVLIKKNAVLTFDYEVFLGQQTGTLKNCVIKPTQLILEILNINKAKAIFFVDATWLLFLKGNFPSDFHIVSSQLKDIVNSGSTVELHLHPQWIKAYKIGESIEFNFSANYKLHSLNQNEILDLFRDSIELLESITLQKITCFRAGGFCIEPFEKIKKVLEVFKITFDFSVVPGMSLNGGNDYDFNFSRAPHLPFYKFENDVQISESKGVFTEIPLSTYNNNPIYRLINLLLLKIKNDKIYGDGIGIQEGRNYFLKSINRRLKFSKAFLTIDKTQHLFFKYLLKFHFKQRDFIVLISHPKTISKQALANLDHVSKGFKTLNTFDLRFFLNQYELEDISK